MFLSSYRGYPLASGLMNVLRTTPLEGKRVSEIPGQCAIHCSFHRADKDCQVGMPRRKTTLRLGLDGSLPAGREAENAPG